jgi:excisionase family DNA binding protein
MMPMTSKYTTSEQLPLMLSVPEIAAVLGISRAAAYELARTKDFPSLRIGTRIVVPKDKFIDWINGRVEEKDAE